MKKFNERKQKTTWMYLLVKLPIAWISAIIKLIVIVPFIIIDWCNEYKERYE